MARSLGSILAELGCQTGTIHRTGADGELKLETQVGVPEFLLPKIASIPFGKGIAGCAAERKRPVQLCNLQTDTSGQARPAAKTTGMEGSIAVPMLVAGELRGVIGVAMAGAHDWTDAEKSLLLAIAAKLGEARP